MTTQKKNHSTQIYMHTKKQLFFFYVFYCKQCGNTIRYALIKLRWYMLL